MADTSKLALPAFLKIFTSNDVPPSTAMNVASKIYKTHNTEAKLAVMSELDLESAGIKNKEDRKLVMSALRKAGYKPQAHGKLVGKTNTASSSKAESPPPKKKRKRDDVANELLLDAPSNEGTAYGSLEFQEVLDEAILKTKSTVVNRAPLMTAWSMVVAERLGFQREEALSIASVYTEMNAISKGVSLGIFKANRERGIEASEGGSQPYVDLMGRRPLYRSQDVSKSSWRALNAGTPAAPTAAYAYIKRSLRQTTPFVVGALRLLAASYDPKVLNDRGFALYAGFRPEQVGWGEKGEVKCATILGLRRQGEESRSANGEAATGIRDAIGEEGPMRKKVHALTVEEYEAQLDDDPSWSEAFQDL